MFNLDVLDKAKICSTNCNPDNPCAVYCVGCGRSCHLACHKVPDQMITSVSAIPKNNRVNGYFGECSYIRLVCDNCANLLISNVPKNGKPCFLSLFNELAKKKNEVIDITDTDTRQSQRNKRKKSDECDAELTDGNSEMTEMKRLLEKCIVKLNNVETAATKTIANKLNEIENAQKSTLAKLQSNGHALEVINTKFDRNATSIDDGMQKGFNRLSELTEKLCTPLNTPHRFGSSRASSMRKYAMDNRARNNYLNGTPTSKPFGGPNIPTESGTATGDEGLFGPAVPRKLNFNAGDNQRSGGGPRKEFRHENAIYIRFVDSSITPAKMTEIMMRNEKIKEAFDINPEVIEVTRLVKNRFTEAEIAQRRFGVSYRIGCSSELFKVVGEKEIWASHWEIRPWDKHYGNNDHNGQRSGDTNFLAAAGVHQNMER